MHNTVPQMGRWNNSLGCMVYDETPQMGSMGTMGFDVNAFVKKTIDNLESSIKTQIKAAPDKLLNTVYATALKDPAVQQKIIETGDRSLLDAIQAKTQEYIQSGYVAVKENPWTTALVVAGGFLVVGTVFYLAFRGARKS